jgi:predicted ATPase
LEKKYNPTSQHEALEVRTSWCVITGSPCSGKTTVLNKLKKLGFRITPEAARVYLETEIAKGRVKEEIRNDEKTFQREIFAIKMKIEDGLPRNELIFMDRALPDSVTYYRVASIDPQEIFAKCRKYRYFAVFKFERLPYFDDLARIETPKTIEYIDKQLEKDYKDLGYQVVKVPKLTVTSRVNFILDYLKVKT